MDQPRAQGRVLQLGIELLTSHRLESFDGRSATLVSKFTGDTTERRCATLVPITSRQPIDTLYHDLAANPEGLQAAGIATVTRIGDCAAPGIIAAAVFAGHRYARELGGNVAEASRDRPEI